MGVGVVTHLPRVALSLPQAHEGGHRGGGRGMSAGAWGEFQYALLARCGRWWDRGSGLKCREQRVKGELSTLLCHRPLSFSCVHSSDQF